MKLFKKVAITAVLAASSFFVSDSALAFGAGEASASATVVLAGAGAGAGAGAWQADKDFWDQPRYLDIYRPALNKRVRAVYWQNGQIYMPGYLEICEAMKDVRGDKTFNMDVRLLDLLYAMQSWVRYYGFNDPIQINSGYRSPETNRRTRGAARNSMHVQGKALDVVFPKLPASYVGQLAARYSGGGVGFYYSGNRVHIDTGSVRQWHQK